MRGAFRIGRLFGIDVGVDWSWTLVFLLLSWNLTVVFHGWHPTWTLAGCSFLAVVAALLFFSSVLAHEFAHSLVAKSFGMKVREIRLFLFGGVSNLEHEPSSAAAEFWMAIAGPLLSIALGTFFIVVSGVTRLAPLVDATELEQRLAGLSPLSTLLFWLGPINLMVGTFNLIPGFPLDGGRVLRAAIWKLTGDLHKATLAASMFGRAIGMVFVVMGIAMVFGATIPFFGHGAGSGVWLAFIGWFLSSAAERSFGALIVQEILVGVRVSQLMRRTDDVVPSATRVRALVHGWFVRSSERAFPVVDEGRLLGLVCVADIRKVAESAWDDTPVTAIMTTRDRLAVVRASDDAEAALRTLKELDVDQLPVVDGEVLVGMFTRADVARWLELHVGTPQSAMRARTA